MLLLLAELPQLLSDSWCWCLVSEPHIWIWKPLHLGNSTHQAVYPTSHDIPIWYSKMIQCAPWYYQIIISSTYVISVFEHSLPSSPGTSSLPRTSMKASRWFSMRSQGCKEVCGWMWNQARTFVKSCKILMRQTQGWPKRNTSSWFKKKQHWVDSLLALPHDATLYHSTCIRKQDFQVSAVSSAWEPIHPIECQEDGCNELTRPEAGQGVLVQPPFRLGKA